MKELIITKEYAGGRMDKMVCRYLDKAPKGFVYKMLRKKNIVLNGKKAAGNELLKDGDVIRFYLADNTIAKFSSLIRLNDSHQGSSHSSSAIMADSNNTFHSKKADSTGKYKEAEAMLSKLNQCLGTAYTSIPEAAESMIVYEDENLIVFNKPAGLLTQRAEIRDVSLNDLLVSYLEYTASSSDSFTNCLKDEPGTKTDGTEQVISLQTMFKPGVSNRLDRNTSGLVLAGKNLYASRELNEAIRGRRISKTYLCLVKGRINEAKTIDGYLVKDEKTNKVRIFDVSEAEDISKPLACDAVRHEAGTGQQGEEIEQPREDIKSPTAETTMLEAARVRNEEESDSSGEDSKYPTAETTKLEVERVRNEEESDLSGEDSKCPTAETTKLEAESARTGEKTVQSGEEAKKSMPAQKGGSPTNLGSRIITAYRPIAGSDRITLLEVDLITGKSHQIRAHLSSIGHPIIGDTKYGSKKSNAFFREKYELKRQLLHAHRVILENLPGELSYLNGKEITAPLPVDMKQICLDSGMTQGDGPFVFD